LIICEAPKKKIIYWFSSRQCG